MLIFPTHSPASRLRRRAPNKIVVVCWSPASSTCKQARTCARGSNGEGACPWTEPDRIGLSEGTSVDGPGTVIVMSDAKGRGTRAWAIRLLM